MSENESEQPTSAIPDEQLPPDLVPGEDNPLAEGLPDGEGSELLEGGKTAEEMDDPPEVGNRDGNGDGDPDAQGTAGEHD